MGVRYGQCSHNEGSEANQVESGSLECQAAELRPCPVGVETGRMSKALSRLVTGSQEGACQHTDCGPGAWRGIQVMSLQPATLKKKRHATRTTHVTLGSRMGKDRSSVAGRQRVTGTWRKHQHLPASFPPSSSPSARWRRRFN